MIMLSRLIGIPVPPLSVRFISIMIVNIRDYRIFGVFDISTLRFIVATLQRGR